MPQQWVAEDPYIVIGCHLSRGGRISLDQRAFDGVTTPNHLICEMLPLNVVHVHRAPAVEVA